MTATVEGAPAEELIEETPYPSDDDPSEPKEDEDQEHPHSEVNCSVDPALKLSTTEPMVVIQIQGLGRRAQGTTYARSLC